MRNHRFWIKIATFAAALCLAFGWNTVALAAEYDDSNITSQAAMLIDESTGTVLYSKNAKEQVAPASTTKIMTASLLMEQIEAGTISLDDVVEVGDEINAGEQVATIRNSDVMELTVSFPALRNDAQLRQRRCPGCGQAGGGDG